MARKDNREKQRRRAEKGGRRRQRTSMPFSAKNYVLMVGGLLLILIGYAIMALENEVDGFVSLYVSPILLIVGYVEIIYAIVWRPKAPSEAI